MANNADLGPPLFAQICLSENLESLKYGNVPKFSDG